MSRVVREEISREKIEFFAAFSAIKDLHPYEIFDWDISVPVERAIGSVPVANFLFKSSYLGRCWPY